MQLGSGTGITGCRGTLVGLSPSSLGKSYMGHAVLMWPTSQRKMGFPQVYGLYGDHAALVTIRLGSNGTFWSCHAGADHQNPIGYGSSSYATAFFCQTPPPSPCRWAQDICFLFIRTKQLLCRKVTVWVEVKSYAVQASQPKHHTHGPSHEELSTPTQGQGRRDQPRAQALLSQSVRTVPPPAVCKI